MASKEARRIVSEIADQMEHKPDACCGAWSWACAVDTPDDMRPYCFDCPRLRVSVTAPVQVMPMDANDLLRTANMLILCGELGGMQPGEHYATYLRRLIDTLILRGKMVTLQRQMLQECERIIEGEE